MGLKEEAQRAWEERKAETKKGRDEEQQGKAIAAKHAFQEMFGAGRIGATKGCEINVAGLTLRYLPHARAFVLRDKCPECEVLCWGGQEIRSLVDLGSVLERFIPNHGHACLAVREALTWEERMQALIREALV